MKILKPPTPLNLSEFDSTTRLFLGGSIEMGKAVNWQEKLTQYLSDIRRLIIFNPRRDDWDSSWLQDPTPGTQFRTQVDWELEAQDNSDFIIYNFEPETISPITLLELGRFSNGNNIYVCCPKEYFRYGNVKILCERYNVTFFEDKEECFKKLKEDILDINAFSNS